MKSHRALRGLAEGALFQATFTALGLAALQRWARVCEAHRRHASHR